MTKWWVCLNTDCEQYDHVASSDGPCNCPACTQPMNFVEENELTDVTIAKSHLTEQTIGQGGPYPEL